MKTLTAALAEHLEGDATTMCHCWRVTRRDGMVLGFTEHDHDLNFSGTDFQAASGFHAADSEAASGLSVEAGEVSGGFSSSAISEADVVAGRYDGARVEVFQVTGSPRTSAFCCGYRRSAMSCARAAPFAPSCGG